MDPVESAADKLSANAWRLPDRVRDWKDDDPSLVRHLHDLAVLKGRALACADFAALVEASMEQDENRAKNVAVAELSVAEKFRFFGISRKSHSILGHCEIVLPSGLLFPAIPKEPKFRQMLEVLESDPEYLKEYDRFVQGVSYATDGSTPDFATAVQAVYALVDVTTRRQTS